MRISEALSLRLCDIANDVIRIREHDGFKPKTKNSYREIPVVDRDLAAMLKRRETQIREKALAAGKLQEVTPETSLWPFYRGQKVRRVPEVVLRNARIALKMQPVKFRGPDGKMRKEDITWHSLRHMVATRLYLKREVSPYSTASLLGHSASMAPVYCHSRVDDQRAAMVMLSGIARTANA